LRDQDLGCSGLPRASSAARIVIMPQSAPMVAGRRAEGAIAGMRSGLQQCAKVSISSKRPGTGDAGWSVMMSRYRHATPLSH